MRFRFPSFESNEVEQSLMASSKPEETHEHKQNIYLCILIMTISGFLRVVATMVLAFPKFLERKRGYSPGGERQKFYNILSVVLHVFLLFVAAIISIVGTFYGPVSTAVPIQTGSTMLFNVVAMGIILKMRAFNKAQRVGTYVVFFSVLSLIDVGPGIQENQDILKLLSRTPALVLSLMITLTMLLAAAFTFPLIGSNTKPVFHKLSFFTLAVGMTMSNVGMTTAGKTLGILDGVAFSVALLYYIVASLLGLLFSIVSSKSCEQGIFTPLTSVALILTNMITGIVVWEDWRVMNTWIGYICACMLMCCGVYLLAEVDILDHYLKRKEASIVRHRENDEEILTTIEVEGDNNKTWQQTNLDAMELLGDNSNVPSLDNNVI